MNPRTAQAAGAETILVVEHEIMTRILICQYLRHCGYRVYEAAHADEAVVVLQRDDLAVDLVLSDTDMPGSMGAFALARWIRRNKPGLAVILVGSPARAAQIAGDLCESGPLLGKPYEPQVLLDRIRRLIGGSGLGGSRAGRARDLHGERVADDPRRREIAESTAGAADVDAGNEPSRQELLCDR